MKGFFAKKNTEPKKKLKEIRIDNIQNLKKEMNLVLKYLRMSSLWMLNLKQ